MRIARLLTIFLALVAVTCIGQMNPLEGYQTPVGPIDSGLIKGNSQAKSALWSTTVYVPEATWLRLRFAVAILGEDPQSANYSVLKITSLEDGAVQLLNAKTIREWRNTSAYFNGPAVKIELISAPNGKPNRIVITDATAGYPTGQGVGAQSICGPTDDRVLSSDPRQGRSVPVGCTSWLIDDPNHCFLSAGHCADGSSMNVIEFNVPLSNGNGNLAHPPPSDQYSVDPTSVQFINGGVGNDFTYFGCYANSTTGMTAYQTQGSNYTLAASPPAISGQAIRVTGYGTVGAPVSPTWNQVQKTHTGAYVTFSGSTLQYTTDTTGGNSGSPVIDDTTGNAIGIHTHGGCSSTSGQNSGTGSNHSGLRTALANPQGVCAAGVAFAFPNGRPFAISPAGGTVLRVVVSGVQGAIPKAGTGMLHYDMGSGWDSVNMTEVSANTYDVVFPAAPCGQQVHYYVSAESTAGTVFKSPGGAPNNLYTGYGATASVDVFSDNFQTNKGWVATNTATAGLWQRGTPAGGGARGDPPTDYDGSGMCYLTGNTAGDSDVDGGSVTLTSPTFDLSGTDAVISYARWFHNSFGGSPFEDVFDVSISNDNGSTWIPVERVGPTGTQVSGGWVVNSFVVGDYFTPTAQMKMRFVASDTGGGSVVEAAVDAFSVTGFTCAQPTTLSGHVDLQLLSGSPSGQAVTLEFRQVGTTNVVATYPVTLDGSGNYSAGVVLTGTYDIAAKGANWLRKVLGSQNVNGATAANFALTNGDCNSDNHVDVFDMNNVLTQFGGTGTGDLDWSSLIDVFDLNIAFTNFGTDGDL